MRNCPFNCEIITDFDLFGKQPEFYYKGKAQKTSYFGLIFSILYVILYVAYFIYKIVRMIQKVDIDFYETNAFSGTPSIALNNQNFYAGFSIGGMIDKTLYYPAIQYWVETRTEGIKNEPYVKNIELEVCQLEKFGKKHQDLYKDKPLENFYCIKDIQEDLIGYGSLDTFSYYYIMIFPCIGTHPDGTECKPLDEVKNFFQKTFLEFTVQDIELTPKDYDKPSEPLIKDITTPVFKGLYQSIFGYFQIVNLETNLDFLGFEALTKIKYDKFLKYEESWIIASPSPHIDDFYPNYPVCDVTIQLTAKVLTIKRDNTKLIDVLGDVGGLMEFVSSLFTIISMFVTDLLYEIDIVNNLFSFDLNKRKILIKNDNQNLEYEGKEIYNPDYLKNKSSFSDSKNIIRGEGFGQSLIKEDNKLMDNPDIIAKKTKGKRKSKRSSNFSLVSNSQIQKEKHMNALEENMNINHRNIRIQEDNNFNNSSNNQKLSLDQKDKSFEDKSNIIENISINKFFVICAFCCIRKRKDVNSYMLEEGNRIIKEKLDVLNIFKKLFYEEQMQEHFKYTKSEINMSDNCQQKLG